ncbi:Hypothetical predicted protein [Pelobates cultripes]|uniref:Uncharacterized protein n=1 Tax=Pelobates cultripes TaxID=61616 RepID=A0AAD1WNR4_PELCU|nr:Hypothetical predicted protein [Pelobates cultripes]
MGKLKQANLLMEGRIAAFQDSKRQRNLKIWSVPEDITDTEVPHYIRRLLRSVLSSFKAKAISMESYFWIPKPAKAPDWVPRDLLICFQSLRSKKLHLRDHAVAYRWGPARKLTVLYDRKRIQIQQQSDARKFFKALGLPTPETLQTPTPGTNPQPSAETWDVRNVQSFYPKARPAAVELNSAGT